MLLFSRAFSALFVLTLHTLRISQDSARGAEPVGDVCVEGLFQGVGVRDCGAAGAGLLPRAQASGAAGCPPQAGSPLAQGSRSPGVKAFQLMGPGPPDQLGSSSLLKVNGLWALTTSTKHLHSRTLVSP